MLQLQTAAASEPVLLISERDPWRFGGVGTHRMLSKGPALLTIPQMKAVLRYLTVSVVLMSALPSPWYL